MTREGVVEKNFSVAVLDETQMKVRTTSPQALQIFKLT